MLYIILTDVSLLFIGIHTAAMDMLGGSGVEKQCRTADIMADAAYSILTKPKSYTGNFVIDEELLRTEGIKDFDVYAVSPGSNVKLLKNYVTNINVFFINSISLT